MTKIGDWKATGKTEVPCLSLCGARWLFISAALHIHYISGSLCFFLSLHLFSSIPNFISASHSFFIFLTKDGYPQLPSLFSLQKYVIHFSVKGFGLLNMNHKNLTSQILFKPSPDHVNGPCYRSKSLTSKPA